MFLRTLLTKLVPILAISLTIEEIAIFHAGRYPVALLMDPTDQLDEAVKQKRPEE